MALAAATFAGSISIYASTMKAETPVVHKTFLSFDDSTINTKELILDEYKSTNNSVNEIISLNEADSKAKAVKIATEAVKSSEAQAVPEEPAQDSTFKLGVTNEEVKQLQANLQKLGFFTGEITGYYGDITVSAVENFQKSHDLKISGIADKETVDKLNYFISRPIYVASRGTERSEASKETPKATATPAAKTATVKTVQATPAPITKGGVQKLPWFGNAEKVFSIGSVATVTDLNTGISFKIKRTYGYNHADCETLTASDTATMLQAIGGSWNWVRRPVIVDVNGTKIAASMAPFPHAGRDDMAANATVSNRSGDYGTGDNLDTVKGNNMNGHFDIHFLGSKTHSSNQVDSQHQAAVNKAYAMTR